MNVFIDDIAITAEGGPEASEKVVMARGLIHQAFTDRWKCRFAADEVAVVASCKKDAAKVAAECGVVGGVKGWASNLGIDTTAAARRGGKLGQHMLGARQRKASSRRKKIGVIRRVAAARACQVFVAGPRAAASYELKYGVCRTRKYRGYDKRQGARSSQQAASGASGRRCWLRVCRRRLLKRPR